jgi:hypothetical protein
MSNLELQVVADYRMALFEEIIDQLKMREIYEYVLLEGDEHDNAYHNPQHCVRTAMRCVELLVANGWRLQRDSAMLICAALFHDFGHTGKRPDRTNIKIAITHLFIAPPVLDYFTRTAIQDIAKMIECTEYPFVIEPTDILQEILRDADLMESIEPFHIQTLAHDLRGELQMDMSAPEFAKAQVDFLNSQTMFTEPAKRIWAKTLEARMASFATVV